MGTGRETAETSDLPAARSCRIVVMGVSGSGKSTLGAAIGQRLGMPYVDGDRYHPQANIDKMTAGRPLTDDDRQGWLDRLARLIGDYRANNQSVLLGCSALKCQYRVRLRAGDRALLFLFLDGDYALILHRMQARAHFFSPQMLATQFDTLQRPDDNEAVRVDIDAPFEVVVDHAVIALRARAPGLGPAKH